jgi:hypothetical protein
VQVQARATTTGEPWVAGIAAVAAVQRISTEVSAIAVATFFSRAADVPTCTTVGFVMVEVGAATRAASRRMPGAVTATFTTVTWAGLQVIASRATAGLRPSTGRITRWTWDALLILTFEAFVTRWITIRFFYALAVVANVIFIFIVASRTTATTVIVISVEIHARSIATRFRRTACWNTRSPARPVDAFMA